MAPVVGQPEAVTRLRRAQQAVDRHQCAAQQREQPEAQPRALVAMNSHYVVKEMAGADVCCGCGGSFTLTHADMSAKIGQQKRDNIKNSGAQVVATGCPACMMQISDMLSRNGDRIRVKHPIEIYAESL